MHRPEIDPTVKRYFVYWLYDGSGRCLYVGRSCNIPDRFRAHLDTKPWFIDVRSLDMQGPFTWDEAVAAERAAIRHGRPVHNVVSHPDNWPIGRRVAG